MTDSDTATAYRGPDIPEPLGEQLRVALGLDERPRRFGDWVEAMATIVDRDEVPVDLDTLCTTDDSPHRATFDGTTTHYRCVLDALVVPFLADDIDRVEVETRSPVSGTAIDITVADGRLDVDPAGALLSFGVAEDVDGPPEDLASPVYAYGRFCPYGHAFPDREEYEAWAGGVEALTMAVPMDDALELARALGGIG